MSCKIALDAKSLKMESLTNYIVLVYDIRGTLCYMHTHIDGRYRFIGTCTYIAHTHLHVHTVMFGGLSGLCFKVFFKSP